MQKKFPAELKILNKNKQVGSKCSRLFLQLCVWFFLLLMLLFLLIKSFLNVACPFLFDPCSLQEVELRCRWQESGPFAEFVVEVHESLGLRGSPGLAGASVAEESLQTQTGVGTIGVEATSMAAAPVSPG